MNRFRTIMFGAVCFACFQLFLYGCGQDNPEKVAKTKPVSKKIELPQKGNNSTPGISVVSNPESNGKKVESKMLAAGPGTDRKPAYRSKGRIDPFAPLVKEPTPVPKTRKGDRPRVETRTELEKVDLSQLKLVGVILADSGNRALVTMANGKGHVITKGTPIGPNSGKVLEISGKGAIIQEEAEDWKGNLFTRKVEMNLQKPLGEGFFEL